MITTAFDAPRYKDFAASTEEFGCECSPVTEGTSRLRDANAVKWTVTWKSASERWRAHETDPPTEMQDVFIALIAWLHDAGHAPCDLELEPILEAEGTGKARGLQRLARVLRYEANEPERSMTPLEEKQMFSEGQICGLYRCLARYEWLAAGERARTGEKVVDAPGIHGDSPDAMVSTSSTKPPSHEKGARCSVLIEGVDEPLSLAEALAITSKWEAVNERRVWLIERKATKQITQEESAELENLQRLAWARRQMVMPLPLKELAAIEEALRRMQLWPDE